MAWTPLPEKVEVTVDTPAPKEFVLDPAKTMVLVVDMENTFCKKGNERSFNVIDGNVKLLAKAREAGAKVMYVQSLRHVESPDHTLFGNKLHLLYGTWDSTIVEEITPEPGETVIPKWSNDVWAWHGIEQALEREGVTSGEWTVLVTGRLRRDLRRSRRPGLREPPVQDDHPPRCHCSERRDGGAHLLALPGAGVQLPDGLHDE